MESGNYKEFPENTARFPPPAVYPRVVRVSRTYHVLTTKPFSPRGSERDNVKEQAVGDPDIDSAPVPFRETKKGADLSESDGGALHVRNPPRSL